MRDIEYNDFAALVRELGGITNELRHIAKDMEEFRQEHSNKFDDIEKRIKVLEDRDIRHLMGFSVAKFLGGICVGVFTLFCYYHMTNLVK